MTKKSFLVWLLKLGISRNNHPEMQLFLIKDYDHDKQLSASILPFSYLTELRHLAAPQCDQDNRSSTQ